MAWLMSVVRDSFVWIGTPVHSPLFVPGDQFAARRAPVTGHRPSAVVRSLKHAISVLQSEKPTRFGCHMVLQQMTSFVVSGNSPPPFRFLSLLPSRFDLS